MDDAASIISALVLNRSLTANYQQLTANLTGKVRREQLNGKSYLVAPLSLIVPGVLNGSKGRLFYPEDEVQKSSTIWNSIPLVVYHPTDANGDPLPANAPGVLEKSGIGFATKSTYNGKQTAEGWFDEERTKQVDNRIYNNLVHGYPIELSTGLYTDNEPTPGNWKGQAYDKVARNYRADHIAILPDQIGACSLNDGCGVLINTKDAKGHGSNKKQLLASMVQKARSVVYQGYDPSNSDHRAHRTAIARELKDQHDMGGADAWDEAGDLMEGKSELKDKYTSNSDVDAVVAALNKFSPQAIEAAAQWHKAHKGVAGATAAPQHPVPAPKPAAVSGHPSGKQMSPEDEKIEAELRKRQEEGRAAIAKQFVDEDAKRSFKPTSPQSQPFRKDVTYTPRGTYAKKAAGTTTPPKPPSKASYVKGKGTKVNVHKDLGNAVLKRQKMGHKAIGVGRDAAGNTFVHMKDHLGQKYTIHHAAGKAPSIHAGHVGPTHNTARLATRNEMVQNLAGPGVAITLNGDVVSNRWTDAARQAAQAARHATGAAVARTNRIPGASAGQAFVDHSDAANRVGKGAALPHEHMDAHLAHRSAGDAHWDESLKGGQHAQAHAKAAAGHYEASQAHLKAHEESVRTSDYQTTNAWSPQARQAAVLAHKATMKTGHAGAIEESRKAMEAVHADNPRNPAEYHERAAKLLGNDPKYREAKTAHYYASDLNKRLSPTGNAYGPGFGPSYWHGIDLSNVPPNIKSAALAIIDSPELSYQKKRQAVQDIVGQFTNNGGPGSGPHPSVSHVLSKPHIKTAGQANQSGQDHWFNDSQAQKDFPSKGNANATKGFRLFGHAVQQEFERRAATTNGGPGSGPHPKGGTHSQYGVDSTNLHKSAVEGIEAIHHSDALPFDRKKQAIQQLARTFDKDSVMADPTDNVRTSIWNKLGQALGIIGNVKDAKGHGSNAKGASIAAHKLTLKAQSKADPSHIGLYGGIGAAVRHSTASMARSEVGEHPTFGHINAHDAHSSAARVAQEVGDSRSAKLHNDAAQAHMGAYQAHQDEANTASTGGFNKKLKQGLSGGGLSDNAKNATRIFGSEATDEDDGEDGRGLAGDSSMDDTTVQDRSMSAFLEAELGGSVPEENSPFGHADDYSGDFTEDGDRRPNDAHATRNAFGEQDGDVDRKDAVDTDIDPAQDPAEVDYDAEEPEEESGHDTDEDPHAGMGPNDHDRRATYHEVAAEDHDAKGRPGLADYHKGEAEKHRKASIEKISGVAAPGISGKAPSPTANTEAEEVLIAVYNRNWPKSKRDKTPGSDFAGPHQSFPIADQTDVEAAAHLVGKAADPEAVKGGIKAIARRKGLRVPEAWTGNDDSDMGDSQDIGGDEGGDTTSNCGPTCTCPECKQKRVITGNEAQAVITALTANVEVSDPADTQTSPTMVVGPDGQVHSTQCQCPFCKSKRATSRGDEMTENMKDAKGHGSNARGSTGAAFAATDKTHHVAALDQQRQHVEASHRADLAKEAARRGDHAKAAEHHEHAAYHHNAAAHGIETVGARPSEHFKPNNELGAKLHRDAAAAHSLAAAHHRSKLTGNSTESVSVSNQGYATMASKRELIDGLVANCSCQENNTWTEDDRPILNAMSTERLAAMYRQKQRLSELATNSLAQAGINPDGSMGDPGNGIFDKNVVQGGVTTKPIPTRKKPGNTSSANGNDNLADDDDRDSYKVTGNED